MARIGQLFGGRSAGTVDRDHDGVDDRVEADTLRDRTVDRDGDGVDDTLRKPAVDRDHDGVDDRVETGTLRKPAVDRDHDGVDDRALSTTERTYRLPGTLPGDADTDRDGIADRRETHTTSVKPVIDKPVLDRDPIAPVSVDPDPEPDVVPVEPGRPARASLAATLGLIVGVVAVATALTGLLATWALPLGAIGLLLSFSGIIAGARRHVAGRGLGTLGVLFSGTAVVFAILAITGQVSWLDTDVDQVARLNTWLDARFSWMQDW